MVPEIKPPEPDFPNVRKHLGSKSLLLRLFGWGSATAVALVALAFTTQTESGSARLQQALNVQTQAAPQAVAQIPLSQPQKSAETRLLEEQVRTLAADRDRLAARVAVLEHSLDDMTGSIKRQVEQQTAALEAKIQTPPTPTANQQAAAAPATTTPTKVELIKIAPVKTEPASTEPAKTEPTKTESTRSSPPPAPVTEVSTPQPETPIADVPLPPTRMAALPPAEPVPEPPRKPEIGVDIGGAPTMEVLNMRWAAVKANFGPLLTGLHPLAVRVHRQNASDFRLLVGPLPSVTAATQLCARFASARVTCRPAKFEGEQLAQR